MGRGSLCLALLAALLAALCPRMAAAQCHITLPDATKQEAEAMQETVAALVGIYAKLNGSRWRLAEMTDVLGAADTLGSLPWGSCAPCRVALHPGSQQGYAAAAWHSAHGSLSGGGGEGGGGGGGGGLSLQLPSYCCWRGVSCCHEPHLAPPGNASAGAGAPLPPPLVVPQGGGGGAAAAPTELDGLLAASCAGLLRDGGSVGALLQGAAPSAAARAGCRRYSVTSLALWGLNLAGPLAVIMPELGALHAHGLRSLDLSKNGLTGSLPPELGGLSRLTGLLLGSNNITGTVPASLANLRQLQQLDLEINKLGGPLDGATLCPPHNSLRLLLIRGNNFAGRLDLRGCPHLQLADIQGNRFAGPLPVDGSNRALSVLRAEHNFFTGPIPLGVWDLPALMALDLTNNSLTGTLPKAVASANFLTQLRLGGNRLRGSLPLAITTLSHLADLDLSDNRELTGTLPRMSWMLGLQSLSVRHTRVRGTIPPELAALPYLELVDIRDTHMTCCSSRQEAQQRRDNGSLLPPYLVLNDLTEPDGGGTEGSGGNGGDSSGGGATTSMEEYITGGNMKCGMVRRSPSSSMVAQGWVSRPMNVSRQAWLVGPEYTWYQRCSCLKGYEPGEVVVTGFPIACGGGNASGNASGAVTPWQCDSVMTVMTCKPSPARPSAGLISGIIVSGLVLLLLLGLLHLSSRRVGKMRRQLEWWRKHLAGMPRGGGEMSLVVTDIEGYSGMFKAAPEAMYRALTLHNNVIRAAKYAHCGSIIQQEGDSFTLAFHTPFDAVAFALQVQLGLMEVAWPQGLAEAAAAAAAGAGAAGAASEDGLGSSGDGSEADPAGSGKGGSGGSPLSANVSASPVSQRLEGMMLLSASSGTSGTRLTRRSRLAAAAAVPGGQEGRGGAADPDAAAAAAAAAAAGRGRHQQQQAACGHSGRSRSPSPSPGSSAASSPTKLGATRRQQQQLGGGSSSSSRPLPLAPPAGAFTAAGMGGSHAAAPARQDSSVSSTLGSRHEAAAAACACAAAGGSSSCSPPGAAATPGSRFLASLGVVGGAGGSATSSSGSHHHYGPARLFRAASGARSSAAAGKAAAPGGGKGAAAGGGQAGGGLFNGLSVRMGVVTGTVPHLAPDAAAAAGSGSGSDSGGPSKLALPGFGGGGPAEGGAAASLAAIMSSGLYKLALDVSDAGAGGQVLLDGPTFAAIKEQLAPLGRVGPGGLSHAALDDAARAQGHSGGGGGGGLLAGGGALWRALARACGVSSCGAGGGKRRPRALLDEAVVLDMGLWERQAGQGGPGTPTSPADEAGTGGARRSLPGAMAAPAHAAAPSRRGSSSDGGGGAAGAAAPGGGGGALLLPPTSPSACSTQGYYGAGVSDTGGGGGGGWGFWGGGAQGGGAGAGGPGGSDGGACRLRLYQVLPPSLAGRALVWGNALSLRGAWTCLDAPYFEAPAALCFGLGPSDAAAGGGSSSSAAAYAYACSSVMQPSCSSSACKGSPGGAAVSLWQLKGSQALALQAGQAALLPPDLLAGSACAGDSGGLARLSPIPALHAVPACSGDMHAAEHLLQQQDGAQCGAGTDVEAPAWQHQDQQLLQGAEQQDHQHHRLKPPPLLLQLQLPGSRPGSCTTTSISAPQEGPPAPSCSPPAHHGCSSGRGPLAAAAAASMPPAWQQQQQQLQVPRLLLVPPVTLVFVGVEGSKLLRKHLVREAHAALSCLFMEVLRHVPGGYMCRMQAGDLKYMVAFAAAPAALQWALAVQEGALYLAYPPSFERTQQLRSEYDAAGGRLVFRGPRLRMGLCEGVPRTVMPDHVGRADYYGSSINSAARYMDAAAHGGQVACELALALAAMRHWEAAAGSGSSGCGGCGCAERAAAAGGPGCAAAPPHGAGVPPPAWCGAGPDSSCSTSSSPTSWGSYTRPGHFQQQHHHHLHHHQQPGAFDGDAGDGPDGTAASTSRSSSEPCTPLTHHQRPGVAPQQLRHSFSAAACHVSDSPHKPPLAAGGVDATGAAALGQQQQPCAHGACSSAAWCGQAPGLQGQQHLLPASPPLFALPDAPCCRVGVVVRALGCFRFKGGSSSSLVAMASVGLASLTPGRDAHTPTQPPKGKGERVLGAAAAAAAAWDAAGVSSGAQQALLQQAGGADSGSCGVTVARGEAPLPAVVQQYRARVPRQMLEGAAAASAADGAPPALPALGAADHGDGSGGGDTQGLKLQVVCSGQLRTDAVPARAAGQHGAAAGCSPGSSHHQQQEQRQPDTQGRHSPATMNCATSSDAAATAGAATPEPLPGVRDVAGLRQKSHSFSAPSRPAFG